MERSAISHLVPFMMREGTFDYAGMGYVLAAFGVGYVVGLPFSGALIARAGHRRTLFMISIVWTIAAICFATATTLTGLISARFLLGLAEAPLFPLFVSWIGAHSSRNMVSFKTGSVEAASYVGMALSGPIAVFLAIRVGWQWAYLVIGSLGLVVAGLSLFLRPADGREPEPSAEAPSRRDFVRQNRRLVVGLALCAVGFAAYNLCKTFYSTWMPAVLVENGGWTSRDVARMTFVQSMAAPVFSILSGLGSALLLRRGLPLTTSRVFPMAVGFLFGASLLLSLPFPHAPIGLLLSVSFIGLISTSALIWCTPNDLTASPRRAAYVAGYLNAIANIGSILSPLIVGAMMSSPNRWTSIVTFVGLSSVAAAAAFAAGYLIIAHMPRQNVA